MSKFSKYLIASDMDGTFLGTGACLLDRNLDAIRYFRESGGLFTLSTGRDASVLELLFPDAPQHLNAPAILSNGAYLYDYNTKQRSHILTIDSTKTLELIRAIKKDFPHLGYRISTQNGFLTDTLSPYLSERLAAFQSVVTVDNPEKYTDLEWHKICYSAPADELAPLFEVIETYTKGKFNVTTSASTLIEIIPLNSSKGHALQKLKRLYPDRTVICVGDFNNDIEMLQAADLAACPSNACPQVKAISSIQLCHHSEGCIADLIYKLENQNL